MDVSPISGVVVLDKPPDVSSAKVVAEVKKILKARKVGHTGTLDPMATGVLVCCINQATRIAQFLISSKKRYCATLQLGIETDTQDATGKVISDTGPVSVTAGEVESVIRQFEGPYLQSPPVYSALKVKGIPLYRYARKGHPVQKPARQVQIDAIEILSIEPPFIRFDVSCSAGTYIRTLCSDIGRKLKCGGHLKVLRRTASGRFTTDAALTIADLKGLADRGRLTERLVPMADALRDMPEATANKALTLQIKHGRVLHTHDIKGLSLPGADRFQGESTHVKILDPNQNLLAVLRHESGSDRLSYVCVFNENID
jgi:tRNA pseudouridine55 synthase